MKYVDILFHLSYSSLVTYYVWVEQKYSELNFITSVMNFGDSMGKLLRVK